jgi:hypothetical protein
MRPIDIEMRTRRQKKKRVFEVIPNWRTYSTGELEPVQIAVIELDHFPGP